MIMTYRFQLLLFILIGVFASCETKNKVGTSPPLTNDEYKSTFGYDSLLGMLFNKYPFGKEFKPFDNRPLHQLYHLEKRIYLPKYEDFIFENRLYAYSSIDNIDFINIYNDSFQFVLPLTDLYYLNLEARKFLIDSTYLGSPLENLNLGKELSLLASYLKIEDKSDLRKLLDIVMEFVDAKSMNNKVEFEKFQIEIKNLIEDKQRWGITKKCLADLKSNNGQLPYDDENKLVYYNGVMIYIFTINAAKIEVEYLNSNCSILSW